VLGFHPPMCLRGMQRDHFNIASNQGCIASNDWAIFISELDSSERMLSRGNFFVFFCGTEEKHKKPK